jgi:hypothetical protein
MDPAKQVFPLQRAALLRIHPDLREVPRSSRARRSNLLYRHKARVNQRPHRTGRQRLATPIRRLIHRHRPVPAARVLTRGAKASKSFSVLRAELPALGHLSSSQPAVLAPCASPAAVLHVNRSRTGAIQGQSQEENRLEKFKKNTSANSADN